MASTNFIDKVTVVEPEWLNEVNGTVWTLFGAATTANSARTALGLGTMATQNANSVAITGGSITGGSITGGSITGGTISGLSSPLAVASGGTGVTTSTGTGATVRANSATLDSLTVETSLQVNRSGSGEDMAIFTSSAASHEAAVRLNATDASSGMALKIANSGNNKQISLRVSSTGGANLYVNQTAAGASTSGTNSIGINSSGSVNFPISATENSTRLFSRNSANLGSPPSAQSWTAVGTYTFAHNLGAIPVLTSVWLECTAADAGYSMGDRIFVQGVSTGTAVSARLPAVNVAADATNVYVQFNSTPYICTKSGASNVNITSGRWNVVVRAWY